MIYNKEINIHFITVSATFIQMHFRKNLGLFKTLSSKSNPVHIHIDKTLI